MLFFLFIIFIGSPDVFRLRKEPINSLSCVRTYVRACVRQFRSYSLNRLIFFGLLALDEGPMDSRSSVRASVRSRRDIWRSMHQIFLKLGTKLHLGETKKMFQADFWKKFSFRPQTPLFLAKKIAFWAYIFETAHQILKIFSQMLDIIVLNDLASVLCARKFSFAPQGGIYTRKSSLLAKMA